MWGRTSARCCAAPLAALYTGIVAIFALGFLINRKFTELVIFFVAAIVVGWLVFAPGEVADAAKAIAGQGLP